MGLVGPDLVSIRRRWGAVAQRELRSDQGSDRRQPLRATWGGVGNVGTVWFEKGECKIAEGGDRSFWRQGLLLGLGETQSRELRNFPRVRSSKFPVERTLGYLLPRYLLPLDWRPEDGGGGGSRQESASASGRTVQSDQRRGASETGTVPTARVRHKEPFRARPHPSPEPARWSACTSGRRAGGNRVSGPCRTARELHWLGTVPSGHHNVPRGLAAELGEGVRCPRRRRRGGLGSPRRRLGGDRVRQCA